VRAAALSLTSTRVAAGRNSISVIEAIRMVLLNL
jgi:hypothetical protein